MLGKLKDGASHDFMINVHGYIWIYDGFLSPALKLGGSTS